MTSPQGADENPDSLREWRIGQLLAHLPPRLQKAIRWLRRPSSRWARIPVGFLFCLGAVFAILPVLVIYLIAQRYLVEGLTGGSIK